MLEHVQRTPEWRVDIVRQNYESSTYSVSPVFSSVDHPNACLGYVFKESLHTADNSFSLQFTLTTHEGRTWFDIIQTYDLVFIYEFDELQFIGIIQDGRYSAQMGSDGPERQLSFTGLSLSGLLATFNLIVDQFLYVGTTTAEAANQQLKAKLTQAMAEGSQVKNIIKTIYDEFFDFALKLGQINASGLGIKAIIDHFIDFDSGLSDKVLLKYPIAMSIYNTGENNVWNILTGLLTPPFYELFFVFDSSLEKYKGIFRQSPFEPADWLALPTAYIPAAYIPEYDMGLSCREVYTYYLCTVAGSGISDKKGMLLSADAGFGGLSAKDEVRWRKYGYRPMIVEFKYFDAAQKATYLATADLMKELAEMLKRWYEHNDEFYTGSISFATISNRYLDPSHGKLRNPKIGEKFYFAQGLFYIEESEHTGRYGGFMKTTLSLTRGYMYDSGGVQREPIPNIGMKFSSMQDIREITETP